MRILQVDTAAEWRGGQVQVALLVEGLRARGHEVLVASPPEGPLARRVGAGVVPVVTGNHPLLPVQLRRWVRTHRPDVVAAQTPHAHGACLLAGVRPVVHRRVDFAVGRDPLSRWKYGRARRYVAVSRAVARVLQAAGVPGERVSVVPDGVRPLPPVPPAPDLAGPGPLVGAVGALVAHKGHRFLVEAMAHLPGVRCVIAGEGPLRSDLERRIHRLGLGGRVRLLGQRDDVAGVLAALDALVQPSLEEGMGQVVVEALSLGRPVVVTTAGGLPEVVGEGSPAVPPGDGEALARAMRRTLDAPPEPAPLQARAALFSAERMVAETLRVYEEVVG